MAAVGPVDGQAHIRLVREIGRAEGLALHGRDQIGLLEVAGQRGLGVLEAGDRSPGDQGVAHRDGDGEHREQGPPVDLEDQAPEESHLDAASRRPSLIGFLLAWGQPVQACLLEAPGSVGPESQRLSSPSRCRTVAAVQADGISKTFDQVRWVLDDVSLIVDPGEVVVLMGRSGSGKTTLLNILAGIEEPTRGRVLIGGIHMSELDPEQRTQARLEELGIVFQRFHLIPELTLRENIELPMKLAGRADVHDRAGMLIETFGLGHLEEAFPATLSGGETQRAAIARGMANQPRALLADEPTANLDEGNARNALDALRQVADELGTGVLVATHDPITDEIGDRTMYLVDGRIVAADKVNRTAVQGVVDGPPS